MSKLLKQNDIQLDLMSSEKKLMFLKFQNKIEIKSFSLILICKDVIRKFENILKNFGCLLFRNVILTKPNRLI